MILQQSPASKAALNLGIAEPEDAVMGVAGEREPEIAGTVVLAPEGSRAEPTSGARE
ncbi:hypothetical protein CPE01_32060 [Cellulomonas persica]|uniref:Uncharacterized protein n=1 Tax=Cellulomonas persica TaxID=76861 RepID=A0A510UXQ7_9CELL|nr:hypothetical protein CPE01_32060 [Cellulomonas persica]